MQSFEITNTKNFMSELLTGERFDAFLLYSAIIKKDILYSFEGELNKDFFGDEEEMVYSLIRWKDIRHHMFDIFKGKKLPVEFRFILYLKGDSREKLLERENLQVPQLKDYILNINYREGRVVVTTGVSYSEFTLDKSAEKVWDNAAAKLLADY